MTQGPQKQMMIDIETLSLRPDALVLSIGVVPFDCIGNNGSGNAANAPWFGAPLLLVPNMLEQVIAGRRIDQDTQKWWSEQPDAAGDHWRNPGEFSGMGVRNALVELAEFVKNAPLIWARGPQFDIVILESLYRQFGLTIPWKYNIVRDVRTALDVMRINPPPAVRNPIPAPDGVPHHPVTDCKMQVNQLWEVGYNQ